MKVLLTRPQIQAKRTASRLIALGHTPLISPVLEIQPRPWTMPEERPEAVLLTSANAVVADISAALLDIPVLAMGDATAVAATAAGFRQVRAVKARGGTQLYNHAHKTGVRRALHLCGRDVTDAARPGGLRVERIVTYSAEKVPLLPEAAEALRGADVDVALLYSSRTAKAFADECSRIGADRSRVRLALIGPALAGHSGSGWRAVHVAAKPDEDALFAAAGLLP